MLGALDLIMSSLSLLFISFLGSLTKGNEGTLCPAQDFQRGAAAGCLKECPQLFSAVCFKFLIWPCYFSVDIYKTWANTADSPSAETLNYVWLWSKNYYIGGTLTVYEGIIFRQLKYKQGWMKGFKWSKISTLHVTWLNASARRPGDWKDVCIQYNAWRCHLKTKYATYTLN